MLTLNILNSDATLNNYIQLQSLSFTGGETLTLNLKLIQIDKSIRYVADVGAVITLDLQNSDGTTLAKTGAFPFADDRSIVQFTFTALETESLISQGISVKIEEGSSVQIASLRGALQKNVLNEGC